MTSNHSCGLDFKTEPKFLSFSRWLGGSVVTRLPTVQMDHSLFFCEGVQNFIPGIDFSIW